MRKKKYKKLVKELQAQVFGLETKLEALKPFIERQTLVNRYEASLPYRRGVAKCPSCGEEAFISGHRCYLCNHPRPTQGSIETWLKENND
jgi:hypothetical protein